MDDRETLKMRICVEFGSWECQTLEHKKSLHLIKDGVRSLVEMCNASCGEGAVLFGVNSDGTVCGLEEGDKDSPQRKIMNEIDRAVAPRMTPEIHIMEEGSVQVIALVARRPRDLPFYTYHGEVRIRCGSTSRPLGPQEARRLYRERDRKFWPGPWRCDTCGHSEHRYASAVVTDEGVLDSYACPECKEGELWPLRSASESSTGPSVR